MRRASVFLSLSGFFGLTPDRRSSIFKQIHEIVFHGNGGYSWHDVYNMPIWLRRYTFQKLKEWYSEQEKQSKQTNKPSIPPKRTPNYNVKAPKK